VNMLVMLVMFVMLGSAACRPRARVRAKPPTSPAGKRLVNPLRDLAPEQLEEVTAMSDQDLERATFVASVEAMISEREHVHRLLCTRLIQARERAASGAHEDAAVVIEELLMVIETGGHWA
jgi:hypothetical protein